MCLSEKEREEAEEAWMWVSEKEREEVGEVWKRLRKKELRVGHVG